MDKTRRNHSDWGNPVPKRQTWYVLTHIWILNIEQRITILQSTPPEKLGNKEDSKRDIYAPQKKMQGTRTTEKIGSKKGMWREVREWEGQKRRSEEDRREQKVWVQGGIEETKIRDALMEGAIKGLKANQALGKYPEIYKDDTTYQSKQQWRGYLKYPQIIMRSITKLYAIIETSFTR